MKTVSPMLLTEVPNSVHWTPTHYVFVERTGPFLKIAPEAWQTAHPFAHCSPKSSFQPVR